MSLRQRDDPRRNTLRAGAFFDLRVRETLLPVVIHDGATLGQ
jgi:hypothetical protein